MGKIIATLTVEKRDRNGVVLESFTQPMRSWTKHFFDLLYEPLGFQINTLASINDINGASRPLIVGGGPNALANLQVGSSPGNVMSPLPGYFSSFGSYSCGLSASAMYSGDNFGIVVGTGNTAVATTDDKLATKVAHGETAGTLLYGGTELYGLTFANPNGSFNIRRYFTNVLGGAIAITECGLYSPAYSSLDSCYIFCIAHDVFGAVTVANGQILSVVYTVTITV